MWFIAMAGTVALFFIMWSVAGLTAAWLSVASVGVLVGIIFGIVGLQYLGRWIDAGDKS